MILLHFVGVCPHEFYGVEDSLSEGSFKLPTYDLRAPHPAMIQERRNTSMSRLQHTQVLSLLFFLPPATALFVNELLEANVAETVKPGNWYSHRYSQPGICGKVTVQASCFPRIGLSADLDIAVADRR